MNTDLSTLRIAEVDSRVGEIESLRGAIARHLIYTVGKDEFAASKRDWLYAVSTAVRDRLIERWMETTRCAYREDAKHIYYLSMEFLPGRALSNALIALGLHDECSEALRELGVDLDELDALEPDPALGNGGLGRLAACFLDSMATLKLPSFGYGIRYEYGMFAQRFVNGNQVEQPDHWLVSGNPWEFPRPEVKYTVQFGGRVEYRDKRAFWVDTEDVLAMAYDTIVPGCDTPAVNTLRLWSATATEAIDLSQFNQGNYTAAIEHKNHSENVSRVLYPDDSTSHGQELRLRQEYFFVSASLQDLLRRFFKTHNGVQQLVDKVAIHLNDTHPAIAVPELMRLLVDEHQLPWTLAWRLCTRIFSYTNHTLMPEALETWPVSVLERVLPRHLRIIYDINEMFLDQLRQTFPGDENLLRRVSLIAEGHVRRVRMAHLSVLASHKVNGVSKLHSQLLTESVFADFHRIFPDRFTNCTNGVTPRRWLALANPALSGLIDRHVGTKWRTQLEQLGELHGLSANEEFIAALQAAKIANKQRLARYIGEITGIRIDSMSLFDVQIKRIHEYKRQLLNVLHVITRYNRILAEPERDWQPRTVIFGGKAASAYAMAKLIIRLIHDVAAVVNNDPRCRDRLKVVFIPNYGVSVAELIMPAADLSEQISTAGTEASGTGNMKMSMNGALTIGTEDGANIEIRDQVGAENIFIFGHRTPEVMALRQAGYQSQTYYQNDPQLKEVLDLIDSGAFSPGDRTRYHDIFNALVRYGDHYLLLADYADYIATQSRVDALFRDPAEWRRKAILNVAGMGPFSADRTIRDYASDTWQIDLPGAR